MQAYLNGFHPGDPEVVPADPRRETGTDLPEDVDVLIVGAGPAGLVLAAQLAAFPDIRTRVIERRDGPLRLGQADGVACRTVEMFDAFGLSHRLLKEAARVTETVFWRPEGDDPDRIARSGRVQDVETGLSEFPHLILNQARVQDFLLEAMQRSASRLEPDYGWEVTQVLAGEPADGPVTVHVRPIGAPDGPAGGERTLRARYVVGCDGARSTVRQQIGRRLSGDSANRAWGVMDVLAVTDFPDVRFKVVVQSAAGNMLIIPREGGYLCRMYVEMDELEPGQRMARDTVEVHDVIAVAKRILHPYDLDVQEVVWWSVYEVGQRLADKFDDVGPAEVGDRAPRVFMAGDACHTHSPKAGLGMNVSMQDAYNLGWKLAAVLEGRSAPALLHTYSAERQTVADELIEFDRRWSSMMSAAPQHAVPTAGEAESAPARSELQEQFALQGRYTAGVATRYGPGPLTGEPTWQRLAAGFRIGERFHSAPVTRLADACPMHLGHVARADGRWRLYAFGDRADPRSSASRLRQACERLAEGPGSVLAAFTPLDADPDAVLDLRGVLQQRHDQLTPMDLPPALRPCKGRYGLRDLEKAFTPAEDDVFDNRGIDRDAGCLVLVRPDQHVAHVLALDALEELGAFLARTMLPAA